MCIICDIKNIIIATFTTAYFATLKMCNLRDINLIYCEITNAYFATLCS